MGMCAFIVRRGVCVFMCMYMYVWTIDPLKLSYIKAKNMFN